MFCFVLLCFFSPIVYFKSFQYAWIASLDIVGLKMRGIWWCSDNMLKNYWGKNPLINTPGTLKAGAAFTLLTTRGPPWCTEYTSSSLPHYHVIMMVWRFFKLGWKPALCVAVQATGEEVERTEPFSLLLQQHRSLEKIHVSREQNTSLEMNFWYVNAPFLICNMQHSEGY